MMLTDDFMNSHLFGDDMNLTYKREGKRERTLGGVFHQGK